MTLMRADRKTLHSCCLQFVDMPCELAFVGPEVLMACPDRMHDNEREVHGAAPI